MTNRQVTLKEIADRANVSVAAVSYALHGKGRMSHQTRTQLEQLLKEANYKPSYKLRPALYVGTHRAFSDMHGLPSLLSKYEGLNACFHSEDIPLRLELLHLPQSPSLDDQLERLLTYHPSGVLLDTELNEDLDAVAQFFKRHDVPAVQIGHVARSQAAGSVVVDSFGGAYTATQHLISQGHTRIATIRWNTANDPASRQKYSGFCCAMDEAGVPRPDAYAVETPLGREGDRQPGRVAVNQLLALAEPPTAVFVENSFVSPSLIYPLPPEQCVPPQIANLDFVHFEAWNLDWIEQVMTSKFNMPQRQVKLLRVNWYQMGQVAGEQLVAILNGETPAVRSTRLAPRLVLASGASEQLLTD